MGARGHDEGSAGGLELVAYRVEDDPGRGGPRRVVDDDEGPAAASTSFGSTTRLPSGRSTGIKSFK